MTYSYKTLAERLLQGKIITLSYEKYNDGTKENPDILINRLCASIEETKDKKNKDLVVFLNKEDEEEINETYEIYRMPFIKDLEKLVYILKETRKQSHL
ncbi:MAG: hypothetical protein WC812_02900 [Candidatus Pacearchaeota archaeon]|jgi:hypothetical protein